MNSKTEILIPKEMRQKRGCKETLFMVWASPSSYKPANEQDIVVQALWTFIWDVCISNLGRNAAILHEISLGSPQFPKHDSEFSPPLNHESFLPNSFQFVIHHLRHKWRLYNRKH
jgi:hypothetical protein